MTNMHCVSRLGLFLAQNSVNVDIFDQCAYAFFLNLCFFFAGCDYVEGHQWSVQRSDHCRAGQPGSRNRSNNDHKTPRLCRAGCPDCGLQLAQGNKEMF